MPNLHCKKCGHEWPDTDGLRCGKCGGDACRDCYERETFEFLRGLRVRPKVILEALKMRRKRLP